MASNDHHEPVTSQPTSKSTSRKVSINSDKGLDNPAYEHTPSRRKISQNSDHGEASRVRKKSILSNSNHPHDHHHTHDPPPHDDVVSVHSGKTSHTVKIKTLGFLSPTIHPLTFYFSTKKSSVMLHWSISLRMHAPLINRVTKQFDNQCWLPNLVVTLSMDERYSLRKIDGSVEHYA